MKKQEVTAKHRGMFNPGYIMKLWNVILSCVLTGCIRQVAA